MTDWEGYAVDSQKNLTIKTPIFTRSRNLILLRQVLRRDLWGKISSFHRTFSNTSCLR